LFIDKNKGFYFLSENVALYTKKEEKMKRKTRVSNFQEVVGKIKDHSILELKFLFPELKKINYRGGFIFILCPFHQETTASCCIFDKHYFREGFNCYGCRRGGSIIDYYRLRKDISFKKAVVDLSKIFNIKIEWKNKP
jgi:DNA primase